VSDPAPGFRHLDEHIVHTWGIWSLVAAEFESPEGQRFERHVVRSPGAVAMVPVLFDAEGSASVVMIDQYRAAFDRLVREFPAGMRDVDGEPPEETARRELVEEAGFDAGELTFLLEYLPSPGLTDATMRLYLATDLRPAPREAHGPEESHLAVVHLPLDEALRQVRSGRIVNVAAVLGVLLVAERLGVR
jgi:8-oxo-dGTP pyrophosphatase MutT (NUDIX family)